MSSEVSPIRPPPPEPQSDVARRAAHDAEQANRLIAQLPHADKTGALARGLMHRYLIELLNAPESLPDRLKAKMLETLHNIVRLEAGEATSITRTDMLAEVREMAAAADDAIKRGKGA